MGEEVSLLCAHLVILTLRNQRNNDVRDTIYLVRKVVDCTFQVICKIACALCQLFFIALYVFMIFDALQLYATITNRVRNGGAVLPRWAVQVE